MIVESNLGFKLRLIPELFYCKRHPQRLIAVLWSRNLEEVQYDKPDRRRS